jgi:hypothetical protein
VTSSNETIGTRSPNVEPFGTTGTIRLMPHNLSYVC